MQIDKAIDRQKDQTPSEEQARRRGFGRVTVMNAARSLRQVVCGSVRDMLYYRANCPFAHKMKKRIEIAKALETWFAAVKRPMPWRKNPTPYVCWLSEIMMQQTTYASVLPYYERFLAKFPTVETLAAADESDVLKAWEGLGYYARARNLLKAAKAFAASGRAVWPDSAAAWAKAPGVGPYTAAALASVLLGERVPVVDGNVARVFARVWELADDFRKLPARQKLAARLQSEIDRAAVPGDFNQAMMELGALVCTPTSPACADCPLAAVCGASRHGTQATFPVKAAKKELPVRRTTAILVTDAEGRVLLVQNRAGGLLKGLWELPIVEPAGDLTQVFSHFRLEQRTLKALRSDAEFRNPREVPLTTATRKTLRQEGLLNR